MCGGFGSCCGCFLCCLGVRLLVWLAFASEEGTFNDVVVLAASSVPSLDLSVFFLERRVRVGCGWLLRPTLHSLLSAGLVVAVVGVVVCWRSVVVRSIRRRAHRLAQASVRGVPLVCWLWFGARSAWAFAPRTGRGGEGSPRRISGRGQVKVGGEGELVGQLVCWLAACLFACV